MGDNILSDFGINLLEEEVDDVIFQTNEFLCDATFTGSQGPFWWILQMCMALVVFRIGWWATIYCQQILLGMLTIFGPIQWAFSLLPKWQDAWAKCITRYLTVHFYGAMLYFVGFYVLLLFDIVLCIQVENLTAITQSEQRVSGLKCCGNDKNKSPATHTFIIREYGGRIAL